jgi:hypothetical protein
MARAHAGHAAIEQQDFSTAGKPEGNAEPDNARADDQDPRPLGDRRAADSRKR